MHNRSSRFLIAFFIGLPIVSLILNGVAWLKYGIDLPFFDDWNNYISGTVDSLEPSHLLKSVNDTRTPVGYVLDALAQRYLDGNSVVYQFLSMIIVLGGLLFFQWRLLYWALADRLVAAACFVFTLLMLQPGTYWGRDNLAYHQALPLLFGLAALTLLFVWEGRDRWRFPGVFLLGVLAGVSYISGAIAVLSMGFALIAAAFVFPPESRARLLRGGVALFTAGVATSYFQLEPMLSQTNFVHRPDAPLAFPYEQDFWFYFLGKTARSLLLPASGPGWSLLAVCVALLVVVALAVYFLAGRFRAAGTGGREFRTGLMFTVLGAGILSYMLMIAAGRTNLRPPEVSAPLDVFVYGFYRFHYFWMTLFWPWAAAAAFVFFDSRKGVRKKILVVATVVLAGIAVVFMVARGALGHDRAHHDEMAWRRPVIACLLSQVQKGEGIFCNEFNQRDASPGYAYARMIGASFVRYFPVLPLAAGSDDPPPLFRLTRDTAQAEMIGLTPESGPPGRYVAGNDSQIVFRSGQPDKMARCSLLDVSVLLRAASPDRAQLFYRLAGQPGFSERHAVIQNVGVPGEGYARLDFQIENLAGFEDELRFDPVMTPQALQIGEIEARCRIAGAGQLKVKGKRK